MYTHKSLAGKYTVPHRAGKKLDFEFLKTFCKALYGADSRPMLEIQLRH